MSVDIHNKKFKEEFKKLIEYSKNTIMYNQELKKKELKKELKKQHPVSIRFANSLNVLVDVSYLIVNGKNKEALELIDTFQKLQYEVVEWCEEDVSKNIITEGEHLEIVNYIKSIYNQIIELKSSLLLIK
jgi:hypothetical protein